MKKIITNPLVIFVVAFGVMNAFVISKSEITFFPKHQKIIKSVVK